MKLGPIEVPTDLIMAPMMDVTTPTFRMLIRNLGGVGLIVTPMVFVSQIVGARKTLAPHLELLEQQRPCSVQIVASGRNEDYIKDAMDFLESYKFDVIDINAGCPAPHTMKSGGGGAFLKPGELGRLRNVIEYCIKYSSRPISVKTRLGFEDPNQINEICDVFKSYNLAFVTIHGRTVRQKYSGHADYTYIKKVKDLLSIPVIGNGDVKNFATYQKIKAETGCDAVMIGRAVMNNPYIFSQIHQQKQALTESRPLPSFPGQNSLQDIRSYITQILGYVDQMSKFWNTPRFRLAEVKRLAIWGIKGLKGYRRVREILSKFMDYDRLYAFFFGPEIEKMLGSEAENATDIEEDDFAF